LDNVSGVLIYKCRRCQKLTKSVHVPNGLFALSLISKGQDYQRGRACLLLVRQMYVCVAMGIMVFPT
jgi:hypothetical protein